MNKYTTWEGQKEDVLPEQEFKLNQIEEFEFGDL